MVTLFIIRLNYHLFETAQAEESLGIWLTATEFLVENHWLLGVTSLKDILAVIVSYVEVHRTFLLETLPSIGFKHLSP